MDATSFCIRNARASATFWMYFCLLRCDPCANWLTGFVLIYKMLERCAYPSRTCYLYQICLIALTLPHVQKACYSNVLAALCKLPFFKQTNKTLSSSRICFIFLTPFWGRVAASLILYKMESYVDFRNEVNGFCSYVLVVKGEKKLAMEETVTSLWFNMVPFPAKRPYGIAG